MFKKLFLSLFLLTQASCFVLLPFIENDHVILEQKSTCKVHTEYKTPKLIKVSEVDRALKNLNNSNAAVRTTAATDLGFLGVKRPTVLEALKIASWKDQSKWVRRAAVKSLFKLAGKDAIPSLKIALNDKDPWVVYSARHALAKLK